YPPAQNIQTGPSSPPPYQVYSWSGDLRLSWAKGKQNFVNTRLDPSPSRRHAWPMIGPHQGRELELMLAGQKHLALFYDTLTEPFENNEEIIPEAAFASYVASGAIRRFQKDIPHPKRNTLARYVCFTTPGNEWRAHAFFYFN